MRQLRGFTLIELLVVIAIIGILSTIVLASLGNVRNNAYDARRKAELKQLQNILALYYAQNGSYPNCTAFTPWNTTHWGLSGVPSCLYTALVPTYISALPKDPQANTEGGTGNYLGDGYPTDKGYMYQGTAGGQGYLIGTNLMTGGGATDVKGNYQVQSP